MQYIKIVGGVAQIVDEVVRSEAPLADFIGNLETKGALQTERLPRGIAFLRYDPAGGYAHYVIEQSPRLQVLHGLDADSPVTLPWVYFTFVVNLVNGRAEGTETTFCHWARSRALTTRHSLYKAAIPNIFSEDSTVCWGDVTTDSGDAIGKIEQRVNEFYLNEFNDDLFDLPYDFGSIQEWANHSADEYSFEDWHHWDNRNAITTVGQVMGHAPDVLPAVRSFPPPPQIFTRRRAVEWAMTAPEGQRRTLLMAVRDALESLPEEPEPEATTEELEAATNG